MCTALPSIGHIGLGIMGLPMARHLCNAGYSVTVYNRTASKSNEAKSFGAYVADTPRSAAERADILITMLSNPAAVHAVMDGEKGALANPKKAQVWIQMSTLDIATTKELARQAEARGVTFVDCPVSGSKKQVEAAELVLLAGCDPQPLLFVTPVLKSLGKTIVHAGPVGAGTALKLALNLIVAQMTTALAESVAFARATGVDPEKLFAAIQAAPAIDNGYFRIKKESMLKKEFPPAFSLENMTKDVRFIDEESKARGLNLPVNRSVRETLERGIAEGLATEDVAAVAKLFKPAPVAR